jgi:hypothetical protein
MTDVDSCQNLQSMLGLADGIILLGVVAFFLMLYRVSDWTLTDNFITKFYTVLTV